MKTPYCTAARMKRREVDALRGDIGSAGRTLGAIETRQLELRDQLSEERRALADWGLCADAYFHRVRGELEQLAERRRQATEALDALRDEARQALAGQMLLDGAAERHRDGERVRLERNEQCESDDRSAALFVLRSRP